MRRVLSETTLAAAVERAATAEEEARRIWPGSPPDWQPRTTAYVAADRFEAATVRRWGELARALLERHAGTGSALRTLTGLETAEPDEWRARVGALLATAPLEDIRIDFEDGYGLRPKSFADGLARRSLRTLDGFLCALLDATGETLPPGLRITYPKVVTPAHVAELGAALARLEAALGLAAGTLAVEVQVETPMSVVDATGANALRGIAAAGGPRIRAAHLGVFDYTAALGLPPAQQRLDHPACDHARDAMQTGLAGTGVELSDGSTNLVPAEDTPAELARVWRTHAAHVTHSLERGFVQGWDLHPAHLVSRVAAVIAFYRADLDGACDRVRDWREQAGAAEVLDEPATVATLLRHLRRAAAAGAVDVADLAARTGLSTAELAAPARRP